MQLLTLDFETYYDDEYSLKEIPTLAYVRSPKFLAHGAAVKLNDSPSFWVDGQDLHEFFNTVMWAYTTVCSHNTYFDGLILVEQYHKRPARWADSLAIARAFLPWLPRHDLQSVARALKLADKLDGLNATKGLRELTPELRASLSAYALRDADIAHGIWSRLIPLAPPEELDLIDLTTRYSVQAILRLDEEQARLAHLEAVAASTQAINGAGLPKDILSSNDKFAAWLQARGIDVPIKAGKRGPIYALAKDDAEFSELRASHPELDHVWRGRLAAKSTIAVTRAATFLAVTHDGSKPLPLPTNYYGAHTGRWSGRDSINVQNLQRKSRLRRAIKAPPGCMVVVGDSKQIELRLNLWFAEEWTPLQLLRDGGDLYRHTASAYLSKPEPDVTPDERQFGKAVELSCGYGLGHKTLRMRLAVGTQDMPPIYLTPIEAAQAIFVYRSGKPALTRRWDDLGQLLQLMAGGLEINDDRFYPIAIRGETIFLPNRMPLSYYNLGTEDDGEMYYGAPGHRTKIYGAKLDENIIQALARVVIAEQKLAADASELLQVVGSTHDEIICIAREQHAEAAARELETIMATPPAWACTGKLMPLPLAAEVAFAPYYMK